MENSRDNRLEQSRAEQSRAEQSRAEHKKYLKKIYNLRKFIVILLAIILVGIAAAGYCGYRLYSSIQSTNSVVSNLSNEVTVLESRLDEVSPSLDDDAKQFLSACDEQHYNILFVGNSITRHPVTDYWWSANRGMAASEDNNDYVHVTDASLSSYGTEKLKSSATEGINFYAFNYAIWETQSHDRAETYPSLDKYLTAGENIDCIVLQLGENVSDTETFESDYCALIDHLRTEAPNAKIIMIGNFWKNETVDAAKISVAQKEGVSYVDLSEIQDQPEYEAGEGTVVTGDDGEQHTITHSGVAKHPGDKGMEWIAEKVFEEIVG